MTDSLPFLSFSRQWRPQSPQFKQPPSIIKSTKINIKGYRAPTIVRSIDSSEATASEMGRQRRMKTEMEIDEAEL